MPFKFLCICQYGHSRSVALARLFHSMGFPAVAIGYATSGDSIEVLSTWATHICVLQECFTKYVPVSWRSKLVVIDVGPDIWVNPYNEDLKKKLTELVSDKLPELFEVIDEKENS